MGISMSGSSSQTPVVEYISEHPDLIIQSSQIWGELGFDVTTHTHKPLQIGDKTYDKGLGHHAPGEVTIDLNGLYDTFETEVGVQSDCPTGSVIFSIFVDGEKKFDSGVLKAGEQAKPVKISVVGAQILTLNAGPGDHDTNGDMANWADTRLTRSISATLASWTTIDLAPFARVVTWDPNRMDGSKANRVQEFHAEDIFMESDLLPSTDGFYTVPVSESGLGCIGLQWIERRKLKNITIDFANPPTVPADQVQVQYWAGESVWQGTWQPIKATVEQEGHKWTFKLDGASSQNLRKGSWKVRFIFPKQDKQVVVKRMVCKSPLRTGKLDMILTSEKPTGHGTVSIYNGEFVDLSGAVSHTATWDMSKPLKMKVRYEITTYWKPDQTVVRLALPYAAFGIATDDLLTNKSVYVKEYGIFATIELDSRSALADYKKSIADKKTVLERVNVMPDQTFEQAMEKTHNPLQNNGPTLLSLACDNHKFMLEQDGRVQFPIQTMPEHDMASFGDWGQAARITPAFGTWTGNLQTRHLEGGWLPIVVSTAEQNGIEYKQRSFVAPVGKGDKSSPWFNDKPLFVAEFTIENKSSKPGEASLELAFLTNGKENKAAAMTVTPSGAAALFDGNLLASVDASQVGSLKTEIQDGKVVLKGEIKSGGKAVCIVYVPGWQAKPEEASHLKGGGNLTTEVKAYWEHVMSPAAQIEIPDQKLEDVIKASQVHCLIAARNEDHDKKVAAWIASVSYGPLESEANSIILGMDLLGHDEFAKRSHDFFIDKYNAEGFLTTGYTLMGTGWQLWTLGEHFQLTRDTEWLKSHAPEVVRVCKWITEQRKKTEKLDANGLHHPEYGLMPPGVQADWNAFAYHFSLNGYYYAGLLHAATALDQIGDPNAKALLADAKEFREDILRAYHWTQSRAPVYELQDGSWVPEYSGQLFCPGPTANFFPGEDGNRSWCYDVELGAHQLVPHGILDPNSKDVDWMMNHMEDVQFLAEGWFDYPADTNHKDWFNLGGFSKVQPYYTRNAEIYAMRDDVKPFVRSYFNDLASLLNEGNLSLWEHFHNAGAWNKTHETGYFLQQTKFMLAMEHGDTLYLAPMVTNNWLKDGMVISAKDLPTRFGRVSYRITSHAGKGYIEAVVEAPTVEHPKELAIRLRHPEEKQIKSATVNGKEARFDAAKGLIYLPTTGKSTVKAEY